MGNDRTYRSNQNNLKFRKIVFYILGTFETLFAFRLIFKLLGANHGSTFVAVIYNISGDFLAHFNGVYKTVVIKGIETESILEPTTIIAMIVYAIIAFGVIWLFEIYEIPKNRGMREV